MCAVRVRTVRPEKDLRWDRLMWERHDLGLGNFCGNRLRQVVGLSGCRLLVFGGQLRLRQLGGGVGTGQEHLAARHADEGASGRHRRLPHGVVLPFVHAPP